MTVPEAPTGVTATRGNAVAVRAVNRNGAVTVVLTLVGLTQGVVPALVVLGVLVGYHLLEAHTLRPLIYGRALKLSPLAVIISILLGTDLAGILGALAAMPVAGAIQVTVAELLRQRAVRRRAASQPMTGP
jgi:predicted PurR-regulated permease PerM